MKKILFFIAALLLCGTMKAQDYHYTYDFHDYESNFPLIGEVYLNGEVLASPSIEIAAFVGDQVRGSEFLLEADPVNYPGRYFVWLGISYTNTGETITFRMYDHATSIEYTDCSTTTLTNADGYGEMWEPFNIYFTAEEPLPYGPDYPWVVTGGYENYMYLETQIQIDGVPVTNTNWEVGAFCGDECRGLGDADNWWVSPDNSNILEIVVGGATGDVINFYLYDVANEQVFPGVCQLSLDWIDDDIGDMFEPLVLNFVTEQIFTKTINAYNGNGGYYLVASPIGEVQATAVENMISNKYDLYYFDQEQDLEWINYEETSNDFTSLVPGKGYLYANNQTVTLKFIGFPYSGDGKVTLTKVDNKDFTGWNLVGNPFAENAYIGNRAFYRMNEEGTEVEPVTDAAIAPMEGVFVIAGQDGEFLTFSTEQTESSKSALLTLSITRSRGNAIDRAIVRFDNGGVLPKFQLNSKNTKVYIPQDNKDFAVVNAGENGEMPVNFKAATNGTYTISVSAQEVEFRYLHLIDNITGADIDLLVTPSYTFEANAADMEYRFKLVFVCGDANDGDDFAFFSNGSWIVNNEGSAVLQVVDVQGRILSSEQIEGSVSKHINAVPGIYMLRLVKGEDVKVQKVVVR